ncbi:MULTISPECIES: hypothetical protein [Arthrobacter]|uniref:hypothetical protein n=1 Tax=Arthrobacter TaxID=1663 RepID=UPI001551F127|nr:hypothetical protein [Arthrobacter globiformis]
MHRGSDESDGTAVGHNVGQTPEEILAYWTPERMAEALPRDIRLPEPEESQPQSEEK